MATENRRKGLFCFGKQTALGTPLADSTAAQTGTTPTGVYTVPIISGGMHPVRERAELPLTRATQAHPGQFIQRARGEGTITILATPNALGLLVYEVMGDVSGAGTTHVFTMVDDLPVPMTTWTQVGDAASWWKFPDTFVTRMVIRGESGDNFQVELEMLSFDAINTGVAPTAAATVIPDMPRFKYIGSQVLLEADSATPVAVDNVESIELEINRALELRYGSFLTPQRFIPDRMVNFGCGLIYDSTQAGGWDFVKGSMGVVDGTLTGIGPSGSVSQYILAGSFEVQCGVHAVPAGTWALTIESNGANWEYETERPDADPGGGPIEFDITGMVRDPGAGATEVTLTLVNTLIGVY